MLLIPISNSVRVELIFNPSDNEDIPESPILLQIINKTIKIKNRIPNSNNKRDELTLRASDNADDPAEPILLKKIAKAQSLQQEENKTSKT